MKKRCLLVFLFLVLLSGCINKEAKEVFVTPITPEKENKFLYNPGTYRGEGNGFHGPIVVNVTVSESKILYIEIESHSEENYLIDMYGNPVIFDDEIVDDEILDDEMDSDQVESEEDDENAIIPDEIETEEVEVLGALDSALSMIVLEQSTNVDVSTHATVSISGLKEAISRALAEAML